MIRVLLPILALLCLINTASAAPVEFDTDTYHLIVVRPVDLWSGDSAWLEDTLTSIRKRRVSYDAIGPDGQFVRGSPTVFQSVGSDPIAQGVEAALQAREGKRGLSALAPRLVAALACRA